LSTTPDRCRRALLCGAALLTLLQAGPARAEIRVDVNHRQVAFPRTAPAQFDGRVFIPLRAVVEALGAQVRWDAGSQTVHGTRGSREFALPIGSHSATVNGKSMSLDAPARLISGNTMVPLRFVAEALGAEVGWDGSEQRVSIDLASDTTAGSVSGELISVQSRGNPPTVTLRVAGVRETYRIGEGTTIMRGTSGARHETVTADQLRAGDQLKVRLDAAGRSAEEIDATGPAAQTGRTVRGTVIQTLPRAKPPLMVVTVQGARQTYDVGSADFFYRAGQGQKRVAALLRDVKSGDHVVIRLDRTGQIAERVDGTHVRAR
jgi:hypothetical protein